MISIKHSTEFKKDFKRLKKRNIKNFVNRFQFIVSELVSRNCLKSNFQDHTLSGNWKGYRECHIFPDVILIYKKDNNVLFLARVGSHSDIFK